MKKNDKHITNIKNENGEKGKSGNSMKNFMPLTLTTQMMWENSFKDTSY